MTDYLNLLKKVYQDDKLGGSVLEMKYMMDAQDKSDEMGIAFNRDAATTYYLDHQCSRDLQRHRFCLPTRRHD